MEQDLVRRGFTTYEELRTAVYNSLIDYLEQKEFIRKAPFDAAAHPVATYDDIDPERVRTFINRAKEKRNFPLTFADGMEKIFSGIHVLTDDGRLTNSALLLFAKDPQRFFRTSEVRCAQFYGTKVEKPIRNYQVFAGSLFEMIDKAVGFVMSRIDARVGTRDHSADAPVDYELPESAVAEAIANAVAHRDYTSNASVQVMLFRDRVEIWNPGRLPDGFTVQKLREMHSSEPTNPVIAHPLFLAGYIEHLGTGTTDLIAACEQYGLQTPEFYQAEDFRTVIYRKTKVSDPDEKVTNSSEKVTNLDKKVTNLDVQYHDLNRKPHLIVYQEYSEEAADDFAESEMHSGSDVVQQCIGQIDVIADEERNEHREDPSSHESLDVVLIGHPSLDKTKSRTEEEESDRKDAVIVEEHHVSGIFTGCIQCYDGLVEDDEDSQGALDLLARYTVEECRFICRPSRRSCEKDRAENG